MGRPTINEIPMTPRERQRRRRAKLAAIDRAGDVLADLSRAHDRAYLAEQDDIRAGVKRLLQQWEKDAAARAGGGSRPGENARGADPATRNAHRDTNETRERSRFFKLLADLRFLRATSL
jgi:hypothetical protein